MAYCTPADVRLIIPLIDASTMSDEDMERFISKADAYIDAKLGDIYVTPFSPVPTLITDISAEYTAYLVFRTIFNANSPNNSNLGQELKENAEKALEQIALGKMVLDAEKVSGIASTTEDAVKIFTLDDITPYKD